MRPSKFQAALLLGCSLLLTHQEFRLLRTQQLQIDLRAAALGPEVGSAAGDVSGVDLSGRRVRLTAEGSTPQILYVMSPDCHWCIENGQNMQAALTAAAGRGWRTVVLALDTPGAVEALSALPAAVVRLSPDRAVRERLRLGSTPQTIVIGADGVIQKVWSGAYTSATSREVESFFGITLPGLETRK